MSEKTNYEKMLAEEEYFPDQELADLAYECSEGLLFINSQPPCYHKGLRMDWCKRYDFNRSYYW